MSTTIINLAEKAFQIYEGIPDRELPRKWQTLPAAKRARWEQIVKTIQAGSVIKTVAQREKEAIEKLEHWFEGVNKVTAGEYPYEVMGRTLRDVGFDPKDPSDEGHRMRVFHKMQDAWDRWCAEVAEEDAAELDTPGRTQT